MKKRLLTIALAVLLLCACFPAPLAAQPVITDNARENTHVNTGNQRQDLIAVAMTQLGYTEAYSNDTKYGDWYGLPYNPWCAMFISWCAEQADISTEILRKSALAEAGKRAFDIPYYDGRTYPPQTGDLFFTREFTHTGIVYGVEGDIVLTVEGNVFQYDAKGGTGEPESQRKLDNQPLTLTSQAPEKEGFLFPADITGDGLLDKEDVMQLLWHVSFPDRYLLN